MIGKSFNNGWELDFGGNNLVARFSMGEIPRRKVQLPHDAMIFESPSPEAPSGSQTGFTHRSGAQVE